MRERSQDKAVFHHIFGNKVTFKPFLKKRVTKCTSSSINHLPTFSFFRLLSKDQTNKMVDRTNKMVTLTNPYDHNLLIENGLDEWVTKKYPDCIIYSNDGSTFKIHKEVFCQTKFMRAILTSAKTIQCQCGTIRVSLPCSKQQCEHLMEFLYMGKISMPVYNRARLVDVLYNLHAVLGYAPNLFYQCHEVFSSDDDDDSVSPFLKKKINVF